MKKLLILSIFLLILYFPALSAQDKVPSQTAKNPLSVGMGLFFFTEKEYPTPDYWYRHSQAAINANFGYDLFKNYYRFGVEAKLLFHWSELYPSTTCYMIGWYNQFNLLGKIKRVRMYVELGLHQSNFYPVKHSYKTEKKPGLFYLGLGYGGSACLNKNLDIYGSVNFYPMLNYEPLRYDYGNSELGLEYYFYERLSLTPP